MRAHHGDVESDTETRGHSSRAPIHHGRSLTWGSLIRMSSVCFLSERTTKHFTIFPDHSHSGGGGGGGGGAD